MMSSYFCPCMKFNIFNLAKEVNEYLQPGLLPELCTVLSWGAIASLVTNLRLIINHLTFIMLWNYLLM